MKGINALDFGRSGQMGKMRGKSAFEFGGSGRVDTILHEIPLSRFKEA
ncbi:hypothetical protein NST84_08125 [Paenibacillus sp. FSL R7-0345]